VEGEAVVRGRDVAAPSAVVASDTVSAFVIASEEGTYGLRVWDAAAPGIAAFGSLDAYPYDPAWVVTAEFVPTAPDTQIDIRHQADLELSRPKPLPGLIRFTRDGVDHELAAFPSGDGDRLQLVFGDATNGDSTYSVGRFLFPTPNGDGTITLDFNRAVLPPCAFSYAFNCPIPPAQNRFASPIEAGEKNVLDTAGQPLH